MDKDKFPYCLRWFSMKCSGLLRKILNFFEQKLFLRNYFSSRIWFHENFSTNQSSVERSINQLWKKVIEFRKTNQSGHTKSFKTIWKLLWTLITLKFLSCHTWEYLANSGFRANIFIKYSMFNGSIPSMSENVVVRTRFEAYTKLVHC